MLTVEEESGLVNLNYQFLGPGTKRKEGLTKGQTGGINSLDASTREPDISYAKHKSLKEWHKTVDLGDSGLEKSERKK